MLFRALWGTTLASLSALFLSPGLALAQEPESAETAPDQEEPPALVPLRSDLVGGHFQVGLTGVLSFPFGSTAKDVGTRTRAGWGGGGIVDLAYGLDRYVALGAYAEWNALGSSKNCTDCTGTFLGTGAFVRYHLGQGLRLDPWVSYGLGYAAFGSEEGPDVAHYSGVEWLRLQVGADWYVTRGFLLGPVLGLSAAHAIERPKLEDPGGPMMRAILGLRIAFDTPGRD